jgi:hypothetical protein
VRRLYKSFGVKGLNDALLAKISSHRVVKRLLLMKILKRE